MVLVVVFFLFKVFLKKCSKNGSFGRVLVLVVVFSFQVLFEKVLKMRKSKLLVESGFWLLFFAFQILLETVLKIKISKLLVDLGFGCCFFLFKFHFKNC